MSKGIRSHRDKRSSQRRRTTIAQNDLSINEALHEISEKRSSQRESILQQISALGDAEVNLINDTSFRAAKKSMSDSHEIAEGKSPHFVSSSQLLGLDANGDDDNKERLNKLTSEFVDLHEDESGPLMNQWVNDRKNYFDFRINRPKEQPGNDNDKLAPSMKSIDDVLCSIKAYVLARITHRMNVGDDYQNMTIRITVDDGTERKHSKDAEWMGRNG